jgi:hypothetical protein
MEEEVQTYRRKLHLSGWTESQSAGVLGFLHVWREDARAIMTSYVESKRFAFITFFDMRHVGDFSYAAQAYGITCKTFCEKRSYDETIDADSVVLTFADDACDVMNTGKVREILNRYGDVLHMSKRSGRSYFVAFYDTRAATKAIAVGRFEEPGIPGYLCIKKFVPASPPQRSRSSSPSRRRRRRSRCRSMSRDIRRRRRSRSRSRDEQRRRRSRSRSRERTRDRSEYSRRDLELLKELLDKLKK